MDSRLKIQFQDTSLKAEGLACRRGGRLVFEGLDFDVGGGDFLLLEGKNGSGKTTLLRLLAGFLQPFSGLLHFGNEQLTSQNVAGTGAFIYSGHQHGLKPVLTLRENSAAFFQLMTGRVLPDDLLFEAADTFGLTALIDHPLRFFSSGQTHRCALLRFALLHRPIWLMDEPTVGLDAENRAQLERLMAAHLGKDGIIIAASHDPIGVVHKTVDMADFAPQLSAEDMWL